MENVIYWYIDIYTLAFMKQEMRIIQMWMDAEKYFIAGYSKKIFCKIFFFLEFICSQYFDTSNNLIQLIWKKTLWVQYKSST